MTEFEYLFAFEAILYGLLITKFLDRWSKLIANYKSNSFYWPHTFLAVSLILGTIGRFANRFTSPDFDSIRSGIDILSNIFLPISLLYFAVIQLFPEENKSVNLKTHLENSRLIFLGGTLFFMHAALDIYLLPHYPFPVYGLVIIGILWLIPFFRYNTLYVKVLSIIMLIVSVIQLIN